MADAERVIAELEANTSEAVKAQRCATRVSVRATVTVEPASLSHRSGTKLRGITGDVSERGCQLLLAKPLLVGDIYEIAFDRDSLDVAPVVGQCVRARLVRADAFEMGVRFLHPITLAETAQAEDRGLL